MTPLGLAGVRLLAAVGLAAVPLSAGTRTVTTTADSGTGSLRQAILDANAHPGPDLIRFAIPGSGVHTISPASALPAVTDIVTIDGYTQPGSRPNALADADDAVILVDLSGAVAPSGAPGLVISHDGCTVRGLAVRGFHPLNGSTGGDGIVVTGDACVIAGNFIGTDPSGLVADGNTEGVSVTGNGNRIGGLSTADRNLIGGSVNAVGLRVSGDDSMILGNFIGLDATGYGNVGNRGAGIVIGGQGATIGRNNPNRIAFNGGAVILPDKGTTGIAILRNSIFGNETNSRGVGGIDLDYEGITPDDACDGDTGANGLQNHPVLISAVSRDGAVDIAFTLDSGPSALFRVEFFAGTECDASGFGQGRDFLGAVNVATDAGCHVSETAHLPLCLEGEFVITATATNGSEETSEFSACLPLTIAAGTTCRLVLPVPPATPSRVRPRV